MVAAIVAPLFVALLILGIVALVLFILYRKGKLGGKHGAQGVFRPGPAAGGATAAGEQNGGAVNHDIEFTDGAVRFSNPMYDTVEKARHPPEVNANSREVVPGAQGSNEPVAEMSEVALNLESQS